MSKKNTDPTCKSCGKLYIPNQLQLEKFIKTLKKPVKINFDKLNQQYTSPKFDEIENQLKQEKKTNKALQQKILQKDIENSQLRQKLLDYEK